jgi:hypothetical protein
VRVPSCYWATPMSPAQAEALIAVLNRIAETLEQQTAQWAAETRHQKRVLEMHPAGAEWCRGIPAAAQSGV